jgi:hypothetical protein
VNPGEIAFFQASEHAPWERVRVMVPPGKGTGDVLAVFMRLRDYTRLIMYSSGRVVEARP